MISVSENMNCGLYVQESCSSLLVLFGFLLLVAAAPVGTSLDLIHQFPLISDIQQFTEGLIQPC